MRNVILIASFIQKLQFGDFMGFVVHCKEVDDQDEDVGFMEFDIRLLLVLNWN